MVATVEVLGVVDAVAAVAEPSADDEWPSHPGIDRSARTPSRTDTGEGPVPCGAGSLGDHTGLSSAFRAAMASARQVG